MGADGGIWAPMAANGRRWRQMGADGTPPLEGKGNPAEGGYFASYIIVEEISDVVVVVVVR